MKHITLVTTALLAAFLLGTSPISQADTSQQLGMCMVDSLNGKERKKLATWIFFGMAAHPEINNYSKITQEDRLQTDKYIGKLITRLLTKDCATHAKKALAEGGPAIENGFRVVGEVAMMELMNDPKVSGSLESYTQYLDLSSLQE